MSQVPIAFGTIVKVRDTPQTRAVFLAGLSGQVYGQTIPSITRVDVIGDLASDFAIKVRFQYEGQFWFAPEQLEFIAARSRPWWKFW